MNSDEEILDDMVENSEEEEDGVDVAQWDSFGLDQRILAGIGTKTKIDI